MARIIRQHILRWCNRLIRCWLPARAVTKRLVVATLLNIFPTYFGAFASNIVQTSFVGRFFFIFILCIGSLYWFFVRRLQARRAGMRSVYSLKDCFHKSRRSTAWGRSPQSSDILYCYSFIASVYSFLYFISHMNKWQLFPEIVISKRSDCYFSRSDKETSCLRQEIVSSASWNINPFGGNNKAHKAYCLAEASTPALPGRERA